MIRDIKYLSLEKKSVRYTGDVGHRQRVSMDRLFQLDRRLSSERLETDILMSSGGFYNKMEIYWTIEIHVSP